MSYPNGVITSPNYPNDYDHNDACAWIINAPPGTQISVSLHSIRSTCSKPGLQSWWFGIKI